MENEMLSNLLSEKNIEKVTSLIVDFTPKIISAVLLLILGWWLIKFINRIVKRFFKKSDYDETLERFVADLINWGLKIVLFTTVVMQLGVASSSLVAMLGAAGLAIGLALQGSLSNFAGGVLILMFKPYKIGDLIEAQGQMGTVKEISIFTTKLLTGGNQQVVIPNGKLSNDTIKNYSAEDTRKDILTFGISYDSDIKKAKEVLLKIVNEHELTLREPAPEVFVANLGDSSVDLSLRFWAKTEDFWALHFYVLETAKEQLEAAGISIPYPHIQVVKA